MEKNPVQPSTLDKTKEETPRTPTTPVSTTLESGLFKNATNENWKEVLTSITKTFTLDEYIDFSYRGQD